MIAAAADALRRGEVIGLPTDTVYALAACLDMPDAVDRLAGMTGRPIGAPLSVLVGSLEQASDLAILDLRSWAMAAAHWPGLLTLVARPSTLVSKLVGTRGRTLALRMPDHDLVLDLVHAAGPLAVAPAAGTEESLARSDEEARSVYRELIGVYLPGACPGVDQSTLVDVTGIRLTVLRQGSVTIE